MSAVGDAIGSATDFLVGGDTTKDTAFTDMSPAEKQRLQEIETQIQSLYGNASQQGASAQASSDQFNKMFQDNLAKFIAGGSNNPNPSPEQLQQATQFVDQTFTNPAQQQLNQYGSDFQSQANARAAALGRSPNADIATQQAIAGEIAKQGMGLQSERGSRIAQQAQQLNNQSYDRGLNQLNVGMQGSNFLNNLTQQALSNRLGLLQGRTGLSNIFQNERKVGQYGTSSGLFTNISGITNGMNSAGDIGHLTNLIGQDNGAAAGATSKNQASGGGGGNGIGAVAGIASMFSDSRLKANIFNAESDLTEFLSSVNPYSFTYKNSQHGEGQFYGVMAQDLEKTPVGKSLVIETSEGKAIDMHKAVSMLLANQALLLKRIKELEHAHN